MGYNGRRSLKILEKSVKVQNLPYPLLRGQPLKYVRSEIIGQKFGICKSKDCSLYDFRRISWGNDFVRCFRISKLPKIRQLVIVEIPPFI